MPDFRETVVCPKAKRYGTLINDTVGTLDIHRFCSKYSYLCRDTSLYCWYS